jgi:3'-phosphoadenosine 5'-phosphosulfate sulfotransferase (PAPS reductase)/FAD synthetase
MSALGELPPVDVAIHADTGHEMQSTYAFAAQWAPWLEEHGVPVMSVTSQGEIIDQWGGVQIPAYTLDGNKRGRIGRQCTNQWKIAPVRRFLQSARLGQPVYLWLGISTDEWHRAKDADVQYITHKHPLLDLGMSRADCLRWLSDHELPSPGKSSCTFCPFHRKAEWQRMKRQGGADWQEAVAVDSAIRSARLPGTLYVHASMQPLQEAVIIPEDYGYTQLDLLASDDDDAECDSGFCFV